MILSSILFNILLFILGLIFLIRGSDLFIERLKLIANKLGVSEFVVGAILASVATTLPEISVSIISSLQGESSLAIGNAIGSVLFNISVILGISSLIMPIKVDERGWKNSLLLFCISIIFGFAAIDGYLSRWEGLILLILYGIFVKRALNGEWANQKEHKEKILVRDIVYVFITGGILVLGSKLLVDSAVFFARMLKISEMIIGLTIVAFGTSLPEFVNTITSIRKKTPNIGVGNIIGACILNILIVSGVAILVNPVILAKEFLYLALPIILLIVLALTISLKRDNIIGRKTGLIFLVLYALFFILNWRI